MMAVWLWVGIFVVAGAVQAGEEWQARDAEHPNLYDEIEPSRTFLEYVYFAVGTISGTGAGDITPSTQVGRVLVFLCTLTCFVWYERCREAFRELIDDLLFSSPPPAISQR